MNAEDEVDVVRDYFKVDVGFVKVSGRRFRVERSEMTRLPDVEAPDADVLLRVEKLARAEMMASDEVKLIFVKGKREIVELCKKLARSGWKILPFYAELDDDALDAVVYLADTAVKHVIVATNLAESSLTIKPVHTVISSCRVHRSEEGPQGISRIHPAWCSQEEVRQQEGRAGRIREGKQLLAVPPSS